MNRTAQIKVFLVGDSPDVFSSCRRRLEARGCDCEFADCEQEVWNVLEQKQFDIVMSVHRGRSARTESLGALLSGSRATIFYALRVERGCWWVPVLKLGEECFGAPALRPTEFANVLDEVLEQIKADLAARAIPTRMALPASHSSKRKPACVLSPVANAEAL